MRMRRLLGGAVLALWCHAQALGQEVPAAKPDAKPAGADESTTAGRLTDAAIVVLVIAASIAAYKAKGKPCACPSDTMSNGRACGSNSAYLKPGGAKPLCFPTDVSAEIVAAYRAGRRMFD